MRQCRRSAPGTRHARDCARARDRAARRGTTLVELMVALLLLTVGIIAAAGTTGVVGRHLDAALALDQSAWLAASQLDSLRALDCTSLRVASGVTVLRGGTVRASWQATRDSTGLIRLTSVATAQRRTPPLLALRASRTCPTP